jgi:spoIIIJ-associated protein
MAGEAPERGEVAAGRDEQLDEELAGVEAEGASVGEAKWGAMKELEHRYPGLNVEHVEFEVLEERPAGDDAGFARVSAVADVSAWRLAEQEFDWKEEPAERVRELLRRIAAHLGLRASVDVEEDDDELRATLSGSELALFIGKHGQTIDAIQLLCGQAAYRGQAGRKRVVVDAGGYRERREGALRRQADRGVADALRYGRPVELDSMSSGERRIVHVYLQDRPDVETHSEGDEPFRRIVITPAGSAGGYSNR